MLKRLLSVILTVVAVVGLPQEASAQYMYLDANANGIPDPSDRLNANGTPTTVDLYVRTNMNRNGTTAVCNTGPEPLTINQYQINLVAVAGTVTYSGYTNRQASMPTTFGEFNPDGVRYKNGNGGGTQVAPGTHLLCTLTITGVSGTPLIDIVDLVAGSQDFTGFGTSCWGNAFDYVYRLDGPNVRLVWGAPGDFTDWDGLGAAGGVNPPTVTNPGNRTVDELTTLAFTVVATDPDPGQTLAYSLTLGTPPATGATINASTGAFSWTPTEAQGPGVYPVTVTATDNGTPAASVGAGFTIQVDEVIPPPVGPSLLVTSQLDHTVKEYDAAGVFVRNAATGAGQPSGLCCPLDAIIGADGNMLVTDGNAIKRFDRATGHFLGILASVVSPVGMTIFENRIYVCQSNSPQIVRSFDAVTGADEGSFIPTVGEGNPYPRDVKVARGRLYVAHWNLGTVEMFDLTTRESLGLLFPPGTGGLVTPSSIAFGPDGNLYVSYAFFVNRYHPTTGQFLGRFVDTGDRSGLRYAIGIAWGPDGNLYVATQNTPGVQRYSGITGAFMDDFVPAGSGGLTAPFHISFTSLRAALTATIDIDPNTINLSSNGQFVTAYIELPSSVQAVSIDVSTVRLVGSVRADQKFGIVGDHDNDGIHDLMVKFSRQELYPFLTNGDNELGVTGRLTSGEEFSGTDVVRVIDHDGEELTASVAPNPLNPSGVLAFHTSKPGRVEVRLFDIHGRLVRTLMEARLLAAGLQEVSIDGQDQRGEVLPSGVYFYRIESVDGVIMGRLAILK